MQCFLFPPGEGRVLCDDPKWQLQRRVQNFELLYMYVHQKVATTSLFSSFNFNQYNSYF